jgi:hypothetical protein
VIVWVVAQVKSDDGDIWELGGIFSTEEKALAACTEPNDCMWSVSMDEAIARETIRVGVYPVSDPARRR